jgi:hypothetical protein
MAISRCAPKLQIIHGDGEPILKLTPDITL